MENDIVLSFLHFTFLRVTSQFCWGPSTGVTQRSVPSPMTCSMKAAWWMASQIPRGARCWLGSPLSAFSMCGAWNRSEILVPSLMVMLHGVEVPGPFHNLAGKSEGESAFPSSQKETTVFTMWPKLLSRSSWSNHWSLVAFRALWSAWSHYTNLRCTRFVLHRSPPFGRKVSYIYMSIFDHISRIFWLGAWKTLRTIDNVLKKEHFNFYLVLLFWGGIITYRLIEFN